eukprot:9479548-Pyramimonas_sp.AAC.1
MVAMMAIMMMMTTTMPSPTTSSQEGGARTDTRTFGPKKTQEGPKKRPRGPQRPPKGPQEAPGGAKYASNRLKPTPQNTRKYRPRAMRGCPSRGGAGPRLGPPG